MAGLSAVWHGCRNQAISLKFRLLSIQFTLEAFGERCAPEGVELRVATSLSDFHGHGALFVIVNDMIDPRAYRIAPHRPRIVGFQQFGRRAHIVHAGVEPKLVAVWIENHCHPVVDRRRYSAGRRSEAIVYESAVQRGANNASAKEQVRRICSRMKLTRF